MKRSPLKRGKPLRAKPLSHAERERRADVREDVAKRDGRRCRLDGVAGAGRCFGPLTFQHCRKASQGGAYSVENGALLCSHHNCELEASADLAAIGAALGLVVRRERS